MKKTLLILGILFFVANVSAEDAEVSEIRDVATPETSEEIPAATPEEVDDLEFKTGIISSTGGGGIKSSVVDTPNLDGVPGEEGNAVSGSVSNNKGKCAAVVSNNSTLTSYSVNYEVQGSNERGVVAFRKNFSARLSPGQTAENNFACREGLAMSLNVKSGRKLE